MNAHSLRSILSRQHVAPFTFFFLFLIVVAFGLAAITGQSAAKEGAINQILQSTPDLNVKDIEKEFNDEDLKVKGEKPRGKWTFMTVFDMSQAKNDSLPVAIVGIQSLSGGGRHFGITKIKRIKVKNRSQRNVNSIQLRWTLAPLDEPKKVLSEGTTPFANIWVEANSSKVVEINTLYPALLLKSLAKDGQLDGSFKLTLGLQEARFSDGSFWRRLATAALLMSPYLDQSQGLRFPDLASLTADIAPPLRSSDTKPTDTPLCTISVCS